ncbi:hypothetical protein [Bradyrhizobium sp. LMG 9283]|uniref:hypothetical protein n=1 Tax=Bradyrhizobium sp. LMG 9283 TaxID=592064 RepID=UPI00388D31CF
MPASDAHEPDIAEDHFRYEMFKRTGQAVSLEAVKAWVSSWGSSDELHRPKAIDVRR